MSARRTGTGTPGRAPGPSDCRHSAPSVGLGAAGGGSRVPVGRRWEPGWQGIGWSRAACAGAGVLRRVSSFARGGERAVKGPTGGLARGASVPAVRYPLSCLRLGSDA